VLGDRGSVRVPSNGSLIFRSIHMVKQKHVCIIGAGVSGVAAAKAFSERGHGVTIVERSGVLGGVWEPARSYPEVQTQSP
jgi:cation diffusion facilitator CzcD-associated flavoprotein CzcO